jgi:hypothetical protein
MPEKVAILVIHGIGQQAPYETLDQFTQGLIHSFQADGAKCTVRPHLDICEDPVREQSQWVRASCHLEFDTPVTMQSDKSTSIGQVSLFEYYWAPITRDKISYAGSLLFLMKSGLTPFRYLAANVSVLSSIGRKKRIPLVIFKEVWRQCALFLPLLVLMAALLAFIAAVPPTRLLRIYREMPATSPVLLTILAIRYLYLWTVGRALIGSFHGKGGWQTSRLWRFCLAAALAANIVLSPFVVSPVLYWIAYAGACVARHATVLPRMLGHWATVVRKLHDETMPSASHDFKSWLNALLFLKPGFTHYHYLTVVACVALAYFARFILINYVGDIAVYVNSDRFSSSFSARAQILDECTAALTKLLQEHVNPTDPASPYLYDRVLVAGHSLGSVIAYDTLNELLDRARSSSVTPTPFGPEDLNKLRGMVTFGCPLNKIFYFFREQLPPAQALRRQLLDVLHGFRMMDALKAYGRQSSGPISVNPDPRWTAAEQALASGFRWINAFALADPVSGRLSFYDLQGDDNQKIFHYLKPGWAHLEYWKDPDFYTFVRKRLL